MTTSKYHFFLLFVWYYLFLSKLYHGIYRITYELLLRPWVTHYIRDQYFT